MEEYGAWGEKTMYGKKTVGTIRSTFLVGPNGKIERAWYNVRADGHAAKVLEDTRRAGEAVAAQCWWAGHHQVVRPPTVAGAARRRPLGNAHPAGAPP